MRSIKNPDVFFEKMKKKPALQKILDDFDKYSVEDLQQVDQPKWIREVLIKRKKHPNVVLTQEQISEFIESCKIEKPRIQYVAIRYIGPTTYFKTNSIQIEVIENELLLAIRTTKSTKIKVDGKLLNIDLFNPNTLDIVKNVENVTEFNILKSNDLWNRLCPGENRQFDERDRKTGSGLPFKILR